MPTLTVLVASFLEPEHVARVREVDGGVRVVYEPTLLRPPRYPADHTGDATVTRTSEQEARWRTLLAEADVLFDFDQTHVEDLPERAPRVRWIQATSAGIGRFVTRHEYAGRMPHTVFTTASGVHAQPMAEFCVLSMLMFTKGLTRMLDDQRRKHWERYAGTDLAGRTLGIVGLGAIGRRVAEIGRALGMTVIGLKRHVDDAAPEALHVDTLLGPPDLPKLLERAEFVVLATPHTGETERMIGATELARMPAGAVLINVGRGALVDETALVEALRSGHLAGASLDVFAEEPLPPTSPLWDMPNVLVSPHSGSTSDRENARLTELFCDNLRRFLDGRPLRNVLDTRRQY